MAVMGERRYYYNAPMGMVELFVSDGISRGEWFMTFYQKPKTGSLKRLVTSWLPQRKTFIEAQIDLDMFARVRKLDEVIINNGGGGDDNGCCKV